MYLTIQLIILEKIKIFNNLDHRFKKDLCTQQSNKQIYKRSEQKSSMSKVTKN